LGERLHPFSLAIRALGIDATHNFSNIG